MSREGYPKQLLALHGEHTLLQTTLVRTQSILGTTAPILVCNQAHRFIVAAQCQPLGVVPAALILEHQGRNTAPAVALAAFCLAEQDPSALMLVMPADHIIQNAEAFNQAVLLATPAAQAGRIVTFGIHATSPETGYGYIKQGPALAGCAGVYQVDTFIEKPPLNQAQAFVEAGNHFWNSGIFLMRASVYLQELARFRPDIHDATLHAWARRQQDMDFCRPGEAEFLGCPSDSVDCAVMQRTSLAVVVPASMGWSDVGAWDALWDALPKDAHANALTGDTLAIDTHHSLVRAESRLVAVLGMSHVAVVETPDAVLVMPLNKAQQVKQLVEELRAHARTEHLEHRRVYRPWGWYEGMDSGERFQVKHLMVNPGQKLSLQMHHHRAEHWVVVSGTAKVTIDGTETLLSENQSTYIPLGHRHQLENPGKLPLHIVEVQSGAYLGEDDIVRLDDAYGRHSPTP